MSPGSDSLPGWLMFYWGMFLSLFFLPHNLGRHFATHSRYVNCAVGQDHSLHLVIVTRIIKSVVVHGLLTRTQKMDRCQGSVAGRGLMGHSASCVLAGEFGGRVSVQCTYGEYFCGQITINFCTWISHSATSLNFEYLNWGGVWFEIFLFLLHSVDYYCRDIFITQFQMHKIIVC